MIDDSHENGKSSGCEPPGGFVQINFDTAKVMWSNLGGQGGQCDESFWSTAEEKELYRCLGVDGAVNPQEIYIVNVGTNNELEERYRRDAAGVLLHVQLECLQRLIGLFALKIVQLVAAFYWHTHPQHQAKVSWNVI